MPLMHKKFNKAIDVLLVFGFKFLTVFKAINKELFSNLPIDSKKTGEKTCVLTPAHVKTST